MILLVLLLRCLDRGEHPPPYRLAPRDRRDIWPEPRARYVVREGACGGRT